MLKERTGALSWTFFFWLTAAPRSVSQVAVRPSCCSTARSEPNSLNCQNLSCSLQDTMLLFVQLML